MLAALTHQISPKIQECELTAIDRHPIDLEAAKSQHDHYCNCLRSQGLDIIELSVNLAFPDSTFIEDTAVVLDELAVIASMGAESRKGEVSGVAAELSKYRKLSFIESPGTLEGGDVLCAGKEIFVGLTTRTNQRGVDELRAILDPYNYKVKAVPVTGCLHLKSAVTALSDTSLLINPDWVDPGYFAEFELISVPAQEPSAANILRINNTVLVHEGFPDTARKLSRAGFHVQTLDISELMKAEAALTCSSILFEIQ